MMRHGFGGHPFGPDEAIQYERMFGKVEHVESGFLYKKEADNARSGNQRIDV
jgi:6-phosphogluconate dehydrogenase